MKTFKLNTQILINFLALISFAASILETHIGSDSREYLIEYKQEYIWFQAYRQCARLNRQLLTIDSAEKQDVIEKLLKATTNQYFWLGANDEFNPSDNADRRFFWSSTGKQFTNTNWLKDYPDKGLSDRHCVQLNGDKKWFNWSCDDKVGFICEEKQLLEPSNKNPNNISDVVQKFIKDFDLKFRSLLKDNMAELNGQLENKLTNITQTAVQKILNKQEISIKELNHEITKQGNDLSDQLKQTAVELNAQFSEKQNFTYHPKNIVFIKQTG